MEGEVYDRKTKPENKKWSLEKADLCLGQIGNWKKQIWLDQVEISLNLKRQIRIDQARLNQVELEKGRLG